jgi:hypothetical protein
VIAKGTRVIVKGLFLPPLQFLIEHKVGRNQEDEGINESNGCAKETETMNRQDFNWKGAVLDSIGGLFLHFLSKHFHKINRLHMKWR